MLKFMDLKSKKGITILALSVTIIILLILAGISISMLTGENGLIKNTGNAKEQAEIDGEKELIGTATVQAMGKDKYGNIEKSKLDSELDKNPGSNNYSSEEVDEGIAVTLKSNRTYLVDNDGNVTEYEIKKAVELPETNGETFSRANGNIEIKFLVGTGYNVGEANKPKIDSKNMVPVNWDGSNWIVTDENNWEYSYDETNKKWANVMLKDTLELEEMDNTAIQSATIAEMKGKKVITEGSMLVWIPRYAYKITYYSDSTKETVVGYSDARGIVDKNGKTPSGMNEQVTSISVEDYYRPHPAFEKDVSQGGWEKKISGLWIGKFETTQKVNGKVTIGSGIKPYCSKTVGTFFTDSQSIGINGSHMAKNSEWGAMAYLTESVYGKNGGYVTKNSNSPEFTKGIINFYQTEVNQSTTQNIYGIYDTFGSACEVTASYIADSSNNYGNIFTSTDDTVNNKTTSTKYATVYAHTEGNGYGSNYAPNINKIFGDAVIETSTAGVAPSSWHSKNSVFPGKNYYGTEYCPYFIRDAQHSSSAGGLTSFDFATGNANAYMTFRMCIIVE